MVDIGGVDNSADLSSELKEQFKLKQRRKKNLTNY
jgi:hypothetical protein